MPYPGTELPFQGTTNTIDIALLTWIACIVGLLFLGMMLVLWYRWWRKKVEKRLQELGALPAERRQRVEPAGQASQSLSQVNVAFEVAEGSTIELIIEALPAVADETPVPSAAEPPQENLTPPPPVEVPVPPAPSLPTTLPAAASSQASVSPQAVVIPPVAVPPTPPVLSAPQSPILPAPSRDAEIASPAFEFSPEYLKGRLEAARQYLARVDWGSVAYQSRWMFFGIVVLAALLVYGAVTRVGTFQLGQAAPAPDSFGRPFYNLHFVRDNLLFLYYASLWQIIAGAGGLLLLVALAIGWGLRRQGKSLDRVWEFAGLSTALALAGLGQWQLNFDPPHYTQGIGLYAAAACGFALWAWQARRRLAAALEPSGRLRWEFLLAAGLVLLTAYTRLSNFPAYPYGVEGDEKNWTSDIVRLMVDRVPDLDGEYRISGVPVTFFMQAPFHFLFGAGINTARFAVISFSILGSLVFYLLLRRLAPWPLAVLGTVLLGFSIADISASRLANVESQVKFWPLLSLALLAYAVKKDRWLAYGVCGISLALTILVFDTTAPLAVVLPLCALVELIRQRKPLVEAIYRLAALVFPSLLVSVLLMGYFPGRFNDYGVAERLQGGALAALWNQFLQVLSSWFIHSEFDFIYSRPGPMLNAALLPWLVFGLVVGLFTLRKPFSAWMLVWFGLLILPVPTLTQRPVARVYYPGLPSVYALIALGIFVYLWELDGLLREWNVDVGKALRVVWGGAVGVALLWVGAYNLYLYFNQVADPQPRQIIRELGEFIHANSGPQVFWLIPYQPGANSQLAAEDRTIELYMHGTGLGIDEIRNSYKTLFLSDLLPELVETLGKYPRVEVLIDRFTTQQEDQTNRVTSTLENCFPQAKITRGANMDLYSLTANDLESAACIPTAISLAGPTQGYLNQPYPLTWKLNNGLAHSGDLVCERSRTDVITVQAEDLTNGGGWQLESTIVMDYQGSGIMFDYPDNAPLRYQDQVPQGEVYVWVRYYKRQLDNWPAVLTFNGVQASFADLKTRDELNTWHWERLGPFYARGHDDDVYFTRPFQGEDFWSIFLDAAQFTTDPAYTPETDLPWTAVTSAPPQFELSAAAGEISFTPDQSGVYRCRLKLSGETKSVDAWGNTPVWSNPVEFHVPEE